MYPHRIHLRGPWQAEPLTRTFIDENGNVVEEPGEVPAPRTMLLPCPWNEGGLGDFAGRVRFQRRFHWPRGLDSHERLWLVCEGADYFAHAWLNGCRLGDHAGAFDPFAFPITRLVGARNDLVIEVDRPREDPGCTCQLIRHEGLGSGGLWLPVALEVRTDWYVEDLAVRAGSGEIHVGAKVVGPANDHVECYVLLDDNTVHYEQGLAPGEWRRTMPMPSTGSTWELRVELVQGANLRDVQGLTVGLPLKGTHSEVVTLVQMMRQPERLAAACAVGKGLVVELPIPLHLAPDSLALAEAERLLGRVITRWGHHPGIVAWRLPPTWRERHPEAAQRLADTVQELDGNRRCT